MNEKSPASEKTEFDIAILAGWLLPMREGHNECLRNQLVGIRDSKIEYVGNPQAIEWTAKKTFNASQKIVTPGFVNGHMHLSMSLFRGLADDLPFEEWLHKYILPLEARLVSPEFVRAGAELAALECIQRGVTTLCDMYYFEDEIADVLDKAGLRALPGETVADFPQPDDKEQKGKNFAILEAMADRYKNHPRITPTVAPHAPYTCSDETLKKALAFAEKHGLPMSIHVSETKAEVENSIKQFGMSPIERLEKLGYGKSVHVAYAHGVHVNEKEMEILAKRRIGVIHNPESNMKLGSGIAPIRTYLKKGVRVGIGTDGAASNNDLNLLKEMDTACKLQKLAHADNTAMTAWQALRLATLDGARALGLADKTGSIEVGKYADINIIDTDAVNMQPMHDPASQLVYASTGTEVETVICHGQVLMEEWNLISMNRRDILTRVARYRERAGF